MEFWESHNMFFLHLGKWIRAWLQCTVWTWEYTSFHTNLSGANVNYGQIVPLWLRDLCQCTMCCLGSMFSFQPSKLRHILKFKSWYTIEHIFVPACSVGRKTWKKLFSWFSNSKFVISGLFFPILSAPKIMFPVPENKKRDKF